jgi:hypothetical protein
LPCAALAVVLVADRESRRWWYGNPAAEIGR